MIRSKKAMGIFWAWLMLALHVLPGAVAPTHAQGTRKDDIVFNSRGVPLAGASVRVCAMPASGQPCTPLALIYSDPGLTQAIANPTATDGMGNYFFYAAPGSYELEISGPQIATKQIPDIILPSNPANPSFTGTISAFSLNLAGNLSVTGNTTVIGNLASGTLNLSNQSTPPGAASPGTINLYTKTADKRLYYKDETGTEIGPLASGSGAQLNVANTFTAAQNIDSDFHTKGPNPSFDLQRYGGYIASTTSPPTLSCTATAGNAVLACTSTADFAVGHGVAVAKAGATPAVLTPSSAAGVSSISVNSNVATVSMASSVSFSVGSSVTIAGSSDVAFNGSFAVSLVTGYNVFNIPVTHANCSPCTIGGSATVVANIPGVVTPQGVLNGANTYSYKVVAVDYNGGLSAGSQAFTTSAGASALGVTNVPVSSYSRAGGLVTFTCAANCNIQNGVEINVAYAGSGARDLTVEGAFVVSSTPTGTTFTILQSGAPNTSGSVTINDNAQVVAKNLIQWVMQPATTMQHIVYRCITSCGTNTNYTIAGVAQGMDSSFADWGFAINGSLLPPYFPANPPSSPINGILSTTITAINGNNVTLASAPVVSLSVTVQHDNTPNVLAICNSGLIGNLGSTIFFSQGASQGGVYVFNSPLPLVACSAFTKLQIGTQVFLNEPWLSRSGMEIEGLGQGSGGNFPSFVTDHVALIGGNSYPLILIANAQALTGGGGTLSNLVVQTARPYQTGIFFDQDNLGNNATQWLFRNVYAQGAVPSQPFKLAGGFGFYWERGAIFQSGATGWGNPPILDDVVDQGLGASNQQLAGIIYMDKTAVGGGEILFDAAGQLLGAGAAHATFNETLNESGYYPTFRFNTGANPVFAIDIIKPSYSDPLGGAAVPMIDLTTAGNISAFRVVDPFCFNGSQPLFAGANQGGVEVVNGTEGCSIIGVNNYIVHNMAGVNISDTYNNASIQFNGTGQMYYTMATPTAPAVTLSGATGPAAGTYFYRILANDANGNSTGASPVSSGITVNGSQGVLLTWTLVPGQVSTTICRGLSAVNIACVSVGSGYQVSGTSYLDGPAIFPNASLPQISTAAAASIGSNGLTGSSIIIPGGGSKATLTGSFSAARAQSLPDVSGVVPVTGYVNSAYDNATRANGAIGANWTIGAGGINIAGNAFQGGTASVHNVAAWSANPFTNFGQFSEVTVLTLNGTTDFIGPMVLVSGNTGYNCIENSSSIFLQRYSGGTGTNLSNTAITGASGDVIRLEVTEPGGALTCYRNGVSVLTATDTTFTSGAPGLDMFDNVATSKNWSGGNLHPLGQLDIEADYTKVQHLNAGVGLGTETFTASPRAEQNVFLPGALTSAWTGATWTTDKAVTVTRVQVQAKTAPAGCTTNAVVQLTNGTTPINVTVAAAANDSGAITQNYAAGSAITVGVQTAAAGCTTSPADANVVVQYRMQ
jgi:hypothetical protein